MANMRRGFVTGGTWCVDLNKMIDFWPPEDSIAEIHQIDVRGGGSASNLAIDMKKLDPAMPVETIGIVGDDENGRFLLHHADSFGIDRRQITVTKELPTQFTDCFGSKRTGRRTHIYYAGAAALLTPDHFDFARTRGRIFHLGLPGIHRLLDEPWQGDANGWVTVLKKARAAGLATNFELVMIEPKRLAGIIRPCLPYLDYLVVNDWEIGALADERTYDQGVTDIAACLRAARNVLDRGSMRLVVVHFPRGAIAVSRDGTVTQQPSVRMPPSAVVGANGAGDAFAAGMLYGLHEGWDVGRSLALAHASAAASLRGASTTDTVERWQTCLQLAEDWSWNDWPS
ncbi:MAG: PfkB family carbohydrate kinase [Dongiaceae bacterium]